MSNPAIDMPLTDESGWSSEFIPTIHTVEGSEEAELFTDLSPYLDGTVTQEVPTVGSMWDDKCLFYAGRLNEVHAEPGVGKTNLNIATAVSVIRDGGKVLYIDPEDTPLGFSNRMRSFGADPAGLRERVFYLHNPDSNQIQRAQAWAQENHPDLIILDGLAESMAAAGSDENIAGDVLSFFRDNLRPFAESGGAVVVADHVTKKSENRGQFARGSSAKAGRYDGVSYEILSGAEYTPRCPGFLKLKIQKDRNGGAGQRGEIMAELHFSPGVDGLTNFQFMSGNFSNRPFRPSVIMDKIVDHLAQHGDTNRTTLRRLGKSQTVDEGIHQLKQEGRIDSRREGRNNMYFLVESSGFGCSSVPTVFPVGSEQDPSSCSHVPPPIGGTGTVDETN